MKRLLTILAMLLLSTSVVFAQAEVGIFYATTGTFGSNASSLLTIDLATGEGTLVGPTGITGTIGGTTFPGVPGLAIKSTGEIFGTNTAENTGLFQIDASSGAGSLVATTGIAGVDGIAFDGNDQLWAVGQAPPPLANLYRVDDVTGAATLVGRTGFAIRGLAFDPTTGVLWGSDGGGGFGGQPADGIYAIDTNTGAATLIGKTGLGGSTADLHFDQQGNLYGSKGGGRRPNILISIDKATGVGTVIGGIGFQAVAGLAARLDRVIVSVDDETPALPTAFALRQNYPNPFNPATTIAYSLPKESRVKLKIFDLLGREVATLVDGVRPAGDFSLDFDASRLASGMYFYQLVAKDLAAHPGQRTTLTKRMLLMK